MEKRYELTAEGKKYIEKGLPEKNLAKLLEKGPLDISSAKKNVENFDIALQWCKKKGLIEIKNGMLFLSKKASFVEEGALNSVLHGEGLEEKIAAVLISRKLIDIKRDSIEKRAEKLVGTEITNLNEDLIKTGRWKDVKIKPYNVEAIGKKENIGKSHPYNSFLFRARQKLAEMGFVEMTGPTIETEFWNFDALYQPQNHPSRNWTETYSMKNPKSGSLPSKNLIQNVKSAHESGFNTGSTGWQYKWDQNKAERLMPRAHDTAISPRYLSGKIQIPGKYFSIVRCYRPDIIDKTHGVEFNQMGGFVIGPGLTFKDLLGLLRDFAFEFTGSRQIRFYSDYYPFTEPSCQVSAKHPELGWIEIAGAGMFREELTKPLGIDEPVIAWGFGIDRLAMYKLGLIDIRDLFSQNLDFLRNAVIVDAKN